MAFLKSSKPIGSTPYYAAPTEIGAPQGLSAYGNPRGRVDQSRSGGAPDEALRHRRRRRRQDRDARHAVAAHSAAAGAAVSSGMVRLAGKRALKRLPEPGVLSISRCAWWRASACLTMARPGPVPPVSRERLRSTR